MKIAIDGNGSASFVASDKIEPALNRSEFFATEGRQFFNGIKRLLTHAIDIKPDFWEYGFMKTTLDLPDDLMREIKIRAVHEQKKLKDAIAEFLRKGMSASKTRRPKIPKPVRLRGGFKPTTEDIEAAIAWGRD